MPRKLTPKICNCGCGGMTQGGDWLSGHDSYTLKAMKEASGGSMLTLKALVEQALGREIKAEIPEDRGQIQEGRE